MDDTFYSNLTKVRSSETQVLWNTETTINGSGKRYWHVVASPLVGEEQIANGLAIVIDDLTERKAREDQLAEVGKYLPEALVANLSSADSIDMSAQERNITALFADVRGFTSFSENLQPEDLMQIINRYLSVASDGINLYEGIVDKYMGDAVTGLWNTQLNPQEDHAQRAIQAAHSVMYDLFALHEVLEANEQLYFGIGIHSGPAVLGNVGGEGRVEFAALGEAMDDCKFLQESAGPGEIIISPQTYELIKDFFEAEAIAPKKMKPGFEHYTVIYKLGKRKKSLETSSLFVDQELLDMLSDLDD
jgi:adenylate cyclase